MFAHFTVQLQDSDNRLKESKEQVEKVQRKFIFMLCLETPYK